MLFFASEIFNNAAVQKAHVACDYNIDQGSVYSFLQVSCDLIFDYYQLNTTMSSQIKVLTKPTKGKFLEDEQDEEPEKQSEPTTQTENDLDMFYLKPEDEAGTFKLIDDKEWNIASTEPTSETIYFTQGHSALSIISVVGAKGVGKSRLLNKLAGKEAFETYQTISRKNSNSGQKLHLKHITRGIDVHSTYHRMLLDCQPLNATSILEDFLLGHSSSPFPRHTLASDPFISCQMISLQLATFLIASCDYLIILQKWLVDVHLLKLLSSAVMMIGEDNLRVKLIVFSPDERVDNDKMKRVFEAGVGKLMVEAYFDNEDELVRYVTAYSSLKCDLYRDDPSKFTGKSWLESCQRIWNTTIKNSSMFSDYAINL